MKLISLDNLNRFWQKVKAYIDSLFKPIEDSEVEAIPDYMPAEQAANLTARISALEATLDSVSKATELIFPRYRLSANSVTDMDIFLNEGIYGFKVSGEVANDPSGLTADRHYNMMVMRFDDNSKFVYQLLFLVNRGVHYGRASNNGVFSDWVTIGTELSAYQPKGYLPVGTDLDKLTQEGMWSLHPEITTGLVNCPISTNLYGTISVTRAIPYGQGTRGIIQEIRLHSGTIIYRMQYDSSWGRWRSVTVSNYT